MKVLIEQENRYALTINGVRVEGFELEFEKNGVAHYRHPQHGVVVASADNAFDEIFSQLFGRNELEEITIFKASVGIVDLFKLRGA